MESPQGWYPDPLGRYDHRWFNGTSWTADVSTNGARHVDPLGIQSTSGPKRRKWPWVILAVLIALSVPGVTLGRAVQKFVNPNPYSVSVDQCEADGAEIIIAIDVTNQGDGSADFSIFVEVLGDPFRQVIRSVTLTAQDVRPNRTSQVTARIPSSQQNVECIVVAVGGELPFGIDLGPIEPVRAKAP